MLILKGTKRAVKSVAFSPDGTLLASGAAEGCVRVWNALDGKPVAVLPQAGATLWTDLDVQFSPAGRHLLVSSDRGDVAVWDLAENRLVKSLFSLPNQQPPPQTVSGASFATDGRLLAMWWGYTEG